MAINFGTANEYYYQILNGTLSSATLQTNLGTAANFDAFTSLIYDAGKFKTMRKNYKAYLTIKGSKLASNASIYKRTYFLNANNSQYYDNIASGIVLSRTTSATTMDQFACAGPDLAGGHAYIKNGTNDGDLYALNYVTQGEYFVNTNLQGEDSHGNPAHYYNEIIFFGGEDSGGSETDDIEALNLITLASTNYANALGNDRSFNGCGGTESASWAVGGNTGGTYYDDIEYMDHDTRAVTNPATLLTENKQDAATSENDTHLYVFGGLVSAGTPSSVINKMDFSDSSVTAPSATLTTSKYRNTASRTYDTILCTGGSASSEDEFYTLDTTDDSLTLESFSLIDSDENTESAEGW